MIPGPYQYCAMNNLIKILAIASVLLGLGACSGKKLAVSSVGYRSVRTSFAQPKAIPDDAKIAVEYFFGSGGSVVAVVYNLTDEVMTIDQTKSFIVDTEGESVSYYDPAVVSSTNGTFTAETDLQTLDLRRRPGQYAVGRATTEGSYSSTTVTVAGQPAVSIGPKGRTALAQRHNIPGIGGVNLGKDGTSDNFTDLTFEQSPLRFTACITYSLEGNPKSEKLVTQFYVNSKIIEPVSDGKVSAAFRKIYNRKPDVLAEPSYMFVVNTNLPAIAPTTKMSILGEMETTATHTDYIQGSLIDYQ